jgi:periplasmic iron binding protein
MRSLGMLTILLMAILSTALACSNGQGGEKSADAAAPAPGTEEAAGFEEFPIGDDIDLGPLTVAGVYFQPVDMRPMGMGLSQADSNLHIEADISANPGNDLGFGAGDWVPYLSIDCEIIDKKSGETIYDGSFMPMSSSDGPHYGANLMLENAGDYTVRFIIHNGEKNGYLLHVDKETGVAGQWWSEPLVAEWDFAYIPREW